MDRVGIGLVGCGQFGESHLEAYRAVPQSVVTAVFDVDRSRAEQIAGRFEIPRVCDRLDELCALPEVQAVDIVTPEPAHLEPVLCAFDHDKPVFVEKPLATDLDHCTQMIDASAKSGCFLMGGHILRFETKYAMLKEEIASGRLGRVVSMHARRNRSKAHLTLYARVHPMLETAIHDIDMMLWYADQPVRRVRGYVRNATGENPDVCWGILEFTDGALGVVQTAWLLPDHGGVALDDAFQVFGTEGVGNLSLVPGSLSFWRDEGYSLPDVSYDPRVMNSARGALRDELAYFCDCVSQNRPPEVNTGQDARRAVLVAKALIESAENERDIDIVDWD